MRRVAELVGQWFAVLVLLGAVAGLVAPDTFAPLAAHVPLLLGIIMFGMGLTLTGQDFALVAKRPGAVVIGVVAQYTIMPALAWAIGHLFGLEGEAMIGMILVGAAPGGTASNVIVYLAKGDTALSVALTTVSTLLAPLLTPALVLWLAGTDLDVTYGSLVTSIAQVVLFPVIAGLLVRTFAGRLVERYMLPYLPLVSVLGIVVVVAGIVGANADAVLSTGLLVALAVIVHNCAGLLLGYGAAAAVRFDEPARRAVSVEVGMQNSGLAASLATTYFSPAAALPAALFSVWHNVSGSVLASYWARRPVVADDRRAAEGASTLQP
ncbi:bile acid:sodium symporter family protein [Krasilnikoviella flava]|uniref:Bile acid:Na+ symporter, BASS family n=1 Tax=Krasilnikoviella flava TaxID=526729 RepID=A0A1T5IP29_9MICO|nr:bile acid:sodium symporter family protein [Krasilnikoviella flava]SKC40768.1 bile acid:Na+ symporter, BASS family [Krasilnikoviella flava]